jgi:predicted Zn-dependent protease
VRKPDVQLLWWEGCPSTERALAELEQAMRDVGLAPDVRMREIKTDEDARQTGFMGSPTILIDGTDVVEAGAESVVGLSCRVYRRRGGGISPTPDPDELRYALRRARERPEVSR